MSLETSVNVFVCECVYLPLCVNVFVCECVYLPLCVNVFVCECVYLPPPLLKQDAKQSHILTRVQQV